MTISARHVELNQLRARCTSLLAAMEMIAGSAPDFVRRFNRSGRATLHFEAIYRGVEQLGGIATDEAREIEREAAREERR